MSKIKIPDGMLKAVLESGDEDEELRIVLSGPKINAVEAALRWLSDNPIVPTGADALTLLQERVASGHLSNEEYSAIPATTVKCVIVEWQRRMFSQKREKCLTKKSSTCL